ncbi:MAG: hypothetical protein ACQSGP_07300 [Frankia sp.]
MKAKPFGRVAAGIGAVVLAGAVAGTAQSASAATRAPAAVRSALVRAPHVGNFPSIAVVRGTNNAVFATTGSGFTDLGGRTYDDPAVAVAPNQIYFLAKGTNDLLYLRDEDSGWREILASPVIGTSLTAAYNGAGSLFVTYVDGGNRVIRLTIGTLSATHPVITATSVGPTSYGAAVNSDGQPLFVSDAYTPGLLGAGTLRQWNGVVQTPPVDTTDKRFLNCGRERLGTAFASADFPVGVVVCKSGTDDSVHFLGNSGPLFLGFGTGRNLGGHIIGSPGIALQSPVNLNSVVYATGTNHHVFAKSVLDLGGIFAQGPWVDLGGVAVGGVQASSWTL